MADRATCEASSHGINLCEKENKDTMIFLVFRKSMYNISLVIIVTVLSLAVSPNAKAAGEKVTLQLRWDHQFQFAGYYAALWQGYYAAAGLDVDIKSAVKKDGKIISATKSVAEGQAEFGIGSADILIAKNNGWPLVVLASIFQHSSARLYAKESAALHSPADLTTLRVGRRVNDLIDVEMQAMLRGEGIDPAVVTPYSYTFGPNELLNDKIDVIQGYSIAAPFIFKKYGIKLKSLQPSAYGVDFYGDSLFTRHELIKNNSDLVQRFLQASLNGWKYALENPVAVADRISRELPRTAPPVDEFHAFNRFQIDGVRKLTLYPVIKIGHINPERWRRMHSFLKQSKLVTGDLNLDEFIFNPKRKKEIKDKRFQKVLTWFLIIIVAASATFLIWIFTLRKTVKRRTNELTEANDQLRAEMAERLQMEAALRGSEERYREFVEGTDDLITRVDSQGRFIYVNHVAEKIFGVSMDQCVGMSAFDFIHPEDRERTEVEFEKWVRNRLESITIENRQVNKITGQVYHMLWVSNLHYDEQGGLTGINGIARDLSSYKKLEAEMLKVKKLESIGILSGGIAHDFNNLLNIIMGNISMAKDDVEPEYGISEFLQEAEIASQRAQDLTSQLLTFAKGGAPVKKEGLIGKLLKESADRTLAGSNVKCEFLISSDLYAVAFDKDQMEQALGNLISNAVESMAGAGSITLRAENVAFDSETVEKSFTIPEGKYVKISIQDHGVGISEEHLNLIFDPYFTTKELGSQKGLGLGLAITYSIVKRHDGYIRVESEVGAGTTFTIYLPAHTKEIKYSDPVETLRPAKPAIYTGKILLMDDETSIRKLARLMLGRLGYESELAKDGTEAIALYKKAYESGEPFDVIILDLTIKGGMGGKDAIKAILKIDPQAKAIVSSGYSDDPVMTDFGKYGFIDALAKPYSKKKLTDTLNSIIT